MFAITKPHQAPISPQPSMTAKSHAKGTINRMVRTTVANNEYTPLPTPWNAAEDSIPKAIAG